MQRQAELITFKEPSEKSQITFCLHLLTSQNPFGDWIGIALNLLPNMKNVSIFTSQLLESYPNVRTPLRSTILSP